MKIGLIESELLDLEVSYRSEDMLQIPYLCVIYINRQITFISTDIET